MKERPLYFITLLLLVQQELRWIQCYDALSVTVKGSNSSLPIPFLKPAEASTRSPGCFAEGGSAYLLYKFPSSGRG